MILWYLHSGVRYAVLLLGLAALGYAVYAAVTERPYDRTGYRLAAGFALSLHAQIFLGVSLLFTGMFHPQLVGHVFLMIFAAVAAQIVPSVMRRREPAERGWWPHAVSILVALALVAVGIVSLGRPILAVGVPGSTP